MNKITEWMIAHPLINASGIEKALDLPHGTIRMDGSRNIPEQHVDRIIVLLSKYGYDISTLIEIPVDATGNNQQQIQEINADTYKFTKTPVGYQFNHKSNGLWNKIEISTIVDKEFIRIK